MSQSINKWMAAGASLLLVLGSCKREYVDAPHPYNEITSFKIAYDTGSLKAAVTNDSIVVYWSGFKAVPDSVAPVITISENATIYPASGQKIALKSGVKYTVTAQDSSKATYTLYLKVYQDEPVTTSNKFSFNVKSAWRIDGFANLIPDTSLTRLYAINAAGQEVNLPIASMDATTIYAKPVPIALADTGYYKIKLVNNIYTIYSSDSAVKVYARPVITTFSPDKGAAGDEVTLTGEYFGTTPADNTVTFNGVAATVTAASSTQLKVLVPVGASTGNITVTVGQYSRTAATPFTVLSAAATTVTTLAGDGANASVDGIGTAASFRTITGLAIDPAGNLYVVENTHKIRKVDAATAVTTFAGSGARAYADGTGTAASFDSPVGIAIGTDGNLYLPDYWNQRIRKISPGAVATTLAGSGTRGFADGTATTAMFSLPRDVAVDANGNVYITDLTNNRIRKISPAGDVTTLAGNGTAGFADGPGATAMFKSPYGIAVDGSGNVYVADNGNHRIRKISPSGNVTTLAGTGTAGFADGAGTAAQFNTPNGLAMDAQGYLYVADGNNHRIRRISPDGTVITWAGSGENSFADGSGSEAKFSTPRGIAIDAAGILYVTAGNRIRKITPP
ncbi:hypothetical protein HB364_12630 [Pseudoflavitalea sp. X16]|uniref:IPT/TIG domain-containing protein n=1 Tax=Paraflavitalea devenefica TaxID=2716334 RepID=UPI0014213445|nr:IPT/TIG domain-containing protein [Paraflavitalea devenefica]NII25933.1 hypothetical protein [Paraflavitalea devenefica]